ncbi:MAG: DNA mismatch repair endonuclease MutL [Verrucomicrobia bacterium]|nr:DNA mismatch repair endonuclease MutL [Verrucomicrobiota bacterium]
MQAPPQIRVLSDAVINKIAAGEVVDRPAAVLKELLENALDAGSTSIRVDLVGGGRQAVVVSDDGCGMSRDDALLSLERHATSKIRDVHDIEHVQTLGFRGEALAALASVSRFTLTTRPREQEGGTEITVSGGRVLDVRETGCSPGTTIAVRNLFFNVPARRKFLRSEQTELAHARQIFLLHALAHPDVAWTLRADEREVYQLAGGASLDERIQQLFGNELIAGLRPVDTVCEGVRVHGLASLPQVTRADRSEQYLFVNGRPASAPVVGFAINEAYQALIPRGRHPVLFLFIELPADQVDVNVHPTKKEVRFRHSSNVRDALIAAIRSAIQLSAAGGPSDPLVNQLMVAARALPALRVVDLPELPAFPYPRLDPAPEGQPMPPPDRSATLLNVTVPNPDSASVSPLPTPAPSPPWSWCRVLGQAGGLYVVLETEEGLILMDPHAAHERVLFEQFMQALRRRGVKMQGLLAPESVDLPPETAERVRLNVGLLKDMGFGIADFGGDSFVVDAVPVFLSAVSARTLLGEIAGTLERGGRRAGTERWAEEQIAMAACKAAVKAQDRLTVQEIERLVRDLALCEMPYTCPHGRPTLIYMSFGELRRKFGRE